MALYQIGKYAIRFWSSRPTSNLDPNVALARISFYDTESTYRGQASFFPDGTELSPPLVDSSGRINIHFNLSQFHAVMEMLRTEQPIYLYYFAQTDAGIATGHEPVGEEEEG